MDKKIIVLGAAGYIGNALTRHLIEKGYDVIPVDNNLKSNLAMSLGIGSIDISDAETMGIDVAFSYDVLRSLLQTQKPTHIINLAQIPSAPFSMMSQQASLLTQTNNIAGSLNVMWAVKESNPDIQIIQIGTAGEFSDWLYKGVEIPEGSRVTVQYEGKDWEIPTPKYGASLYHTAKSHASLNADYLCRVWGLSITDINQGIVYGYVPKNNFYYDSIFGTVVNRFVTQAVAGVPLTIYGKTGGQMRSFINIKNSVEAIELLINNPAAKGEYRTIHQLTELYKVREIAEMVQKLTGCDIQYIPNPRKEMDDNEFKYEAKKLKTLGLTVIPMESELQNLINFVTENKDRINVNNLIIEHKWN